MNILSATLNQTLIVEGIDRLVTAANGGEALDTENVTLPQFAQDLERVLPTLVTNKNAKVKHPTMETA